MKLRPTPVPGTCLERPRLTSMLADAGAPFTLVAAGPGYGKTVAVGHWLATVTEPVAWVSLDRGDDAPRSLWRSVAASIWRTTGSVGKEALAMLDGGQDVEPAVAALLEDLDADPDPLLLVLDDLHVLRSPGVLEPLAGFIEHLPEATRVVATARFDPLLPLGRWRAAGRMAEVRQSDLCFTGEEVGALFAWAGIVELDAADLELLGRRTEGWAAGLQLALLSLRDRPDAHEYIRSSLSGDRGIVDYLLGEVLASLSEQDRTLILDLSVLSDFDAGLAVAVTGRADAPTRVRDLEARGLLLLPADDRGERFRFHQLLRELLEAELRWRAPDRVAALHVAAADHLEATGSHREAASHLVAAGEVERAFRLIVAPAWELLDRGEVVAARQQLDLLPEGVVGTDVDRLLSYLVLLTAAGRSDLAARMAARPTPRATAIASR